MFSEQTLRGIGETRGQAGESENTGSLRAAFYGAVLRNRIFPRIFGASWDYHRYFLKFIYERLHGRTVLELGVNAGETAEILPNDNAYTGVDRSLRLLTAARRKFRKAGFPEPRFCSGPEEDLLHRDESFDIVLCNFTLMRTDDPAGLLREAGRTLVAGGEMVGCVPVPERNRTGRALPGHPAGEEELGIRFAGNGFVFEPLEFENGSLLYFLAKKKNPAA